jgi:hypothetical protein
MGEASRSGDHDPWEAVPWRRTGMCGRTVVPGAAGVSLRVMAGDDGPTAFAAGQFHCARHLCPVCGSVLKTRRAIELDLAARRHVEQGGTMVMVTATMRHTADHSLADLLAALQGSWTSVQQSAVWRSVRSSLVGTVKALEITTGHAPDAKYRHGWHPHLHVLLMVEAGAHDAVLDGLSRLPEMWANRVERRLGARPGAAGVDIRPLGADAAAYLSKVTDEITRSDWKQGRQVGSLYDALEAGEAYALPVVQELWTATKGKRWLVFSRGLRAALLPDVEELTDEEIIEQELAAVEVEVVSIEVWRDWLSTAGEDGRTPRAAYELERIEREWVEARAASPP